MRVLKRDGAHEDISFDKIRKRIHNLCTGLTEVDADAISQRVISRIYDGVKTSELDELAAQMCASLVTDHPNYGVLASRIIISNHHKNTSPSFSEAMGLLYNATDVRGERNPLISDELWEIILTHNVKLNTIVSYDRDYDIDYFGFKTLERSYLMKVGGKIVERPQHMWLRVALGIHGWDIKDAIETYDMMSRRKFTHATPTLFNAGTPRPQMASCFLKGVGDSVGGMYTSIADCAQISKYAGGIGVHISNIRASGSHIRGTNGTSSGLVPFMRVYNDTARHISQGSKRLGSFAIYLEPWHADVEAFLEVRKNHGDENERCRDLFTALWVPDLFMKRVAEKGEWSLMCPDESPGLQDVYGDAFDALYLRYESEGKFRRKVKAQTLWLAILKSQIETGTPYMLYKDAVNRKSNQKNIGTIRSSNLCVAPETLLLTREGDRPIAELAGTEVAVWNGAEWSEVVVRKTNDAAELLRVSMTDGETLDCTPYHKFYVIDGDGEPNETRAEELKPGDRLAFWKMPPDGVGTEIVRDVIASVERTGRVDATYCVSEPKLHRAVFNGILTGNCTEINEYSDDTSYATCNLGSIALSMMVKPNAETGEPEFDFAELHRISQILTKNINKVIDRTFYPVEKTIAPNKLHRPIGIGVQGLADAYALMRLPFDSDAAAELNRDIFETIYHGAVTASMEIAKKRALLRDELEALGGLFASLAGSDELSALGKGGAERAAEIKKHLALLPEEEALAKWRGAYATFAGSPASEGVLQYDMWGVAESSLSGRWDWATLKADIARWGMRNSLLLAPMPTASTSQILGNNECFEPITSNIYQRRTLAGEFTLINKYLIKDLLDLGVWDRDMKNKIIAGAGSIQGIAEIPEEIRALYKTAWEIRQRVLIDQSADRGAFVCQSQSLNWFVEEPDYTKLTNMHFYAWNKGLKTGMYYLRTRPKAKTMAFTLDPTLVGNTAMSGGAAAGAAAGGSPSARSPAKIVGDAGDDEPVFACRRDDPQCEMCSS